MNANPAGSQPPSPYLHVPSHPLPPAGEPPSALTPSSSAFFPTSPTSQHSTEDSRPPSFAYPELADLPELPGLAGAGNESLQHTIGDHGAHEEGEEGDVWRNRDQPPVRQGSGLPGHGLVMSSGRQVLSPVQEQPAAHGHGHWWEPSRSLRPQQHPDDAGRTPRMLHYADEISLSPSQDREPAPPESELGPAHTTPHTLVGEYPPNHTPRTLAPLSPFTLKGSPPPQLPPAPNLALPPAIHITAPSFPSSAAAPLGLSNLSGTRGAALRRRSTLASTISATSGSSTSSSSTGWGPIQGLANLVERAIARWARHAHRDGDSSSTSSEESSKSGRSSLISYPTYRAPPRIERGFHLLLPGEERERGRHGVSHLAPGGEAAGREEQAEERFVRTQDLAKVLGKLEVELQRRYRHRRHHRRGAPSGGGAASASAAAGTGVGEGEGVQQEQVEGGDRVRRRRRREKSRMREFDPTSGSGGGSGQLGAAAGAADEESGTSTPDQFALGGFTPVGSSTPVSATYTGYSVTPGSPTSPTHAQANPQAHGSSSSYATPAQLLRADQGSRVGSGVNLSLLDTLHQNLAAAARGNLGGSGSASGTGSPVAGQGGYTAAGPVHGVMGGGHPAAAVHGSHGLHAGHTQTLAVPPSLAAGHTAASSPISPLPLPGKERSAWWLDVASPTPSDMRALGKILHLHPLTLEDVLFQDPREKLDLYPRLGYYFVTFSAIPSREEAPGMPYTKTLDPDTFSIASNASSNSATAGRWEGVDLGDLGPSKVEGVQIYMVVFADGIVTFHFHDFEQHLTAVRERALRLERMFPILADWIAHGLVDSIVDAYLPIIKRLERETDRLASTIQSFSFHKGEPRFNAPDGSKSPPTTAAAAAAADYVGKRDGDLFKGGFEGTGEEGVLGATAFDSAREKQQARRRTGNGSSSAGSSSRDREREREEEIEMEEKTNAAIDRQVEHNVAREQELEREAEEVHTHWDGPIRPPRRRLAFLLDVYAMLIGLLPHKGLQRAMSIEPQRPKPPHPRVVTLYRIASARRMVTSITRLLVHKPVVLSSLRRRFSGVKGIKGDVGVYLDDVEDHVIGMQQALAYCDGTLSQLHPGYLSQLKVAFENAKNGMDKRLLFLSLISISILTIQVWIGVFSMNTTVPTNLYTGGFEIFGFVFLGMVGLLSFVMGLVRYWWVASKRKYKERRWNR